MARLRVGVIGLGKRWPRFRQALLALKRDATIVAVCDPSTECAKSEAQRLGCFATGSVIDLVERDDVDAVVLTGGSWWQLWPLDAAVRVGKPVLCTGSLLREPEWLSGSGECYNPPSNLFESAPIHMAMWPAFELLTEAVSRILGESLGRPRLVLASRVMGSEGDPLDSPATLAFLHGIAGVFESTPHSVTTVSVSDRPEFMNVLLSFAEGGVGQLSLWGGPAESASASLEVHAEGGSLRACVPRSLNWNDAEGNHSLELPGGLAEVWVVDRFVQAVLREELPACSFADAYRALCWLHAARKSRVEGKIVSLA